MPTWHTITRGLALLRFKRDWPVAIELLNQVDQDPKAGEFLSIGIHNRWSEWRKEAAEGGRRAPALDVSLMSPILYIDFLSRIEFQWENSSLNLKGYQLHLKDKEIRWKLLGYKSELRPLVRMTREAENAGDPETTWELLQILASGALPQYNSWRSNDLFATRFPMAVYLSHARARSAISSELERLDVLAAKPSSRPPVIVTAALELSRGDEAAAKLRMANERVPPSVTLPPISERLDHLRDFVSQADFHAADPAAWWSQWMKSHLKD